MSEILPENEPAGRTRKNPGFREDTGFEFQGIQGSTLRRTKSFVGPVGSVKETWLLVTLRFAE